MKIWTVEEVKEGTAGTLLQKGSCTVKGVGTDSRSDLKDKVFFALHGENFDGHEFAGRAAEKGAAVLVVDKEIPKVDPDVTVIKVDNTLKALQRFGTWHRRRWTGKVVAVTGSNGKTTTKEFSHTLLSQKFPTLCTQGNLNNHIGVPLTLLQLRPQHKFAIIEMGMNHEGEITGLVELAAPDIVLVTNVGRAHIEFFGTIERIAKAKEEIYDAADVKSTRIYNLDNTYTATMRARAPGGCKVFTYSSYAKDVDVSLKDKLFTLEYLEVAGTIGGEPGQARIPSFGRQQVSNAMAASCIALACGIAAPLIWKGLQQCRSGWGRGQLVELDSGAKVLFDAYNANPDSCAIAFDNFSKVAARGKKYVVFGDMLELGETSAELHREMGRLIAAIQPEGVLLLGEHSKEVEAGLRSTGFKKNILISNTYEEKLATSFGGVLQTGDVVLVKGSRGMKLERVVECWGPQNFDNH